MRSRLTLIVHAIAVLIVLADLLLRRADVLTIVALVVAAATIGVYCPNRKEI